MNQPTRWVRVTRVLCVRVWKQSSSATPASCLDTRPTERERKTHVSNANFFFKL